MTQILNGTYEILEPVGKGGMSVVFKARHIRLDKLVAVKSVRKDRTASLQAEAGILTKLAHPNLVRVLDVFEDERLIYIVMDYIEGEDLQHLIEREKAVPEDRLTEWFITLADILSYLHSRKPPVIYRDMKPANIILQKDGTLKLVDFGIAREYKAAASSDTAYAGTNGFAAPEQFGMAQSDARTDIYSLGMTMYYLATGKSPLEPPYNYIPARQLNPDLSEKMEGILGKCIRFKPENRYQSAAELLEDLKGTAAAPVKTGKAEKKRPAGLYAGIGIAAAAVLAGILFFSRSGSTQLPAGASQPPGGTASAASEETVPAAQPQGESAADSDDIPDVQVSDAVLRAGFSSDTTGDIAGVFNPALAKSDADEYICSLLFDGLLKTDPEGSYIPELAESWEVSDDGKTYTFRLRDAVFTDGTPVTADDVVFTYQTFMETDSGDPYSYAGEYFDYIQTVDEKTVRFHVVYPGSTVPRLFTAGILSREYYAYGSMEEFREKQNSPMGCGIMTLENWVPGERADLVRNDSYYGDPLQFKGISLLEMNEADLADALQDGEIDIARIASSAADADQTDVFRHNDIDLDRLALTIEETAQVKEMDNASLVSFTESCLSVCFTTVRAHTAEVRVRQALLYGFDRQAFFDDIFKSEDIAILSVSPVPGCAREAIGDDVLNPYDYDPDRAAELLDREGWTVNPATGIREKDVSGDGVIRAEDFETLELEWAVYAGSAFERKLAETAAESWGKIGVKLRISELEGEDFIFSTSMIDPTEPEYDIFAMYDPFRPDWPVMQYLITNSGENTSGWQSSRLFTQRSNPLGEPDPQKRAELLRQVAEIQNEELPITGIVHINEIWGISTRVHGLENMSLYADFTDLVSGVTID
ncbi:MAG: protein kinase [Solobacterium sp.]|nr:protein kinase [Solobacterium sp.]